MVKDKKKEGWVSKFLRGILTVCVSMLALTFCIWYFFPNSNLDTDIPEGYEEECFAYETITKSIFVRSRIHDTCVNDKVSTILLDYKDWRTDEYVDCGDVTFELDDDLNLHKRIHNLNDGGFEFTGDCMIYNFGEAEAFRIAYELNCVIPSHMENITKKICTKKHLVKKIKEE